MGFSNCLLVLFAPVLLLSIDSTNFMAVVSAQGTTTNTTTTDIDSSTPSSSSSSTPLQQQCSVTVNANNETCGAYLQDVPPSTAVCDCYNFCNAKFTGCLAFGERVTFSCSGEMVAGCLEEQRQYFNAATTEGSPSSSSAAGSTAGLAGVIITVLFTSVGLWRMMMDGS